MGTWSWLKGKKNVDYQSILKALYYHCKVIITHQILGETVAEYAILFLPD